MFVISIFAALFMAMIPIKWHFEFKADEFVAELVGKEHIKSVLLKLADENTLNEHTETHPSIAEKFRHIERLRD